MTGTHCVVEGDPLSVAQTIITYGDDRPEPDRDFFTLTTPVRGPRLSGSEAEIVVTIAPIVAFDCNDDV